MALQQFLPGPLFPGNDNKGTDAGVICRQAAAEVKGRPGLKLDLHPNARQPRNFKFRSDPLPSPFPSWAFPPALKSRARAGIPAAVVHLCAAAGS